MSHEELLKLCAELDEKAKAAHLPILETISVSPYGDYAFGLTVEPRSLLSAPQSNDYIVAAANSIPTLTAEIRRLVSRENMGSSFFRPEDFPYLNHGHAELVADQANKGVAMLHEACAVSAKERDATFKWNGQIIQERDRLTAALEAEREQRGELVTALIDARSWIAEPEIQEKILNVLEKVK